MSLRARLIGAISATLCVLLAVLLPLWVTQERERADRDLALRTALLEFAAELASPADVLDRETLLLRGDRLHPLVRTMACYDVPPGGIPASRPPHLWGEPLEDPDAAVRAQRMVAAAARTGLLQFERNAAAVPLRAPSQSGSGTTRVEMVTYLEIEGGQVLPAAAAQKSWLAITFATVVLVAVSWLLVDRLVVRPLGEVSAAAERVAVGDYSQPVPDSGRDDEIQRVIQAFNRMMVDVARLQGRMRAQIGDVLAEARKTQHTLVIAQRLAATGRLAAGIAHEVNNPLAGMLEAVRALRTRDLSPAKRDEYLELVEEGLRRVQATVARILQFTPHKVAPRKLTMDEIVRPVLGLARHRIEAQGVNVTIEGADEQARVFGDAYELQQAVLNVVLNALDAMQDGGTRAPALLIRTSADDREVRLTVRDSGPGIREEDLPRVFDLFFTTKEPGKGTGLGLATAHTILTDHGGRMDLRSDPGGGVEVEFGLPRLRE